MTTLVIYLGGGMDGGSVVVPDLKSPHRKAYEELRPTIKIDNPIPLKYGLAAHPALAPIMPLFEKGELSILCGVGGSILNRSHFAQKAYVMSGSTPLRLNNGGVFPKSPTDHPLAILGADQPRTLPIFRGPIDSGTAMPNPKNFGSAWNRDFFSEEAVSSALEQYLDDTEFHDDGKNAEMILDAASKFKDLKFPDYGSLPFRSKKLAEQAQYILADKEKNIKFLSFEMGGWDHHTNLKAQMQQRLTELSLGLARFWEDLREEKKNVKVLVFTEFGRTIRENGTQGTDHGHGTVAFTLSTDIEETLVNSENWWNMTEGSDFRDFGEDKNACLMSLPYNSIFADFKEKV